ncbi:hypothetical protein [Candidatus Entotheonella palauensis]|uniref:Cytochrome c domain-containing protein n=1 Tax=Candidatus Entotheonella gemina TaxID=1429439 RepID=W4MEU0_9BACT|nr:hypothetical protein [Candidatus Entotheonella palauensis]ETX08436.1 MAG: hypothetical protein ETSY2_05465 [Candidatus Entotheonella gemina]
MVKTILILLAIAVLGVIVFAVIRFPDKPIRYADPIENFKYGSIGSDIDNGLPMDIIRVLPAMFPEYLPEGAQAQDYTAFGLIQEPGRDLPIGFSVRRRYGFLKVVGFNCSFCHTGSVRATAESQPMIIPTMPSNTFDLLAFFEFLFDCAADSRFNAKDVIAAIKKQKSVNPLEWLMYQVAVPRFKGGFLQQREQVSYLQPTPYTDFPAYVVQDDAELNAVYEARQAQEQPFFKTYPGFPAHPRFGPGRVDTFNTYKMIQFARAYHNEPWPMAQSIGNADFPSVWGMGFRQEKKIPFHWDGNTPNLRDRNFTAAFGAGVIPENIKSPEEYGAIDAVGNWLSQTKAPAYPHDSDQEHFPLNRELANQGKVVFEQSCYNCHGENGDMLGKIVPLEEIGTDPYRLDSYTQKLRDLFLEYTKGYDFAFSSLRKTNGYKSPYLDGIWARAPYLHNGSVPNMMALLTPPEERPKVFFRGGDVYDPVGLGFKADEPEQNGKTLFRFDTALPGNGNQGHTYGTELSQADKAALIEYLKTL